MQVDRLKFGQIIDITPLKAFARKIGENQWLPAALDACPHGHAIAPKNVLYRLGYFSYNQRIRLTHHYFRQLVRGHVFRIVE